MAGYATLRAGVSEGVITSTSMHYLKPTQESPDVVREYDACYYEIGADEEQVPEGQVAEVISFRLSQSKGVNVYIYGGTSRSNATETIV